MEFANLEDFVTQRMRMSHVYQPLLIRLLVEAGGTATVRQLARGFAAADEAQVAYYEDRIKQMPIPVLKRHGVVDKDGDLVSLNTKRLTFEQAVKLQAECNARIASFLAARGQDAWTGMLESAPVVDSVRYEVLKRDRACVLCGAGRGMPRSRLTTSFPARGAGRTTCRICKCYVGRVIEGSRTGTTPTYVRVIDHGGERDHRPRAQRPVSIRGLAKRGPSHQCPGRVHGVAQRTVPVCRDLLAGPPRVTRSLRPP